MEKLVRVNFAHEYGNADEAVAIIRGQISYDITALDRIKVGLTDEELKLSREEQDDISFEKAEKIKIKEHLRTNVHSIKIVGLANIKNGTLVISKSVLKKLNEAVDEMEKEQHEEMDKLTLADYWRDL